MTKRAVLRGGYGLLGRELDFAPTRHDIVIENGRVNSIHLTRDDGDSDAIDMRGRLLVPGLINENAAQNTQAGSW